MMSKLKINRFVISFMSAALLAAGAVYAAVKPGQTAPDFTLKSAGGTNTRLHEQRGKVVLVNFWATWCGPCRKEMPKLEAIYQQYRGSGFTLLGVNIDNDPGNAMKMVRKLKVTFPILFDTDKKVSELYKVSAMPFTIIIDRDGKVRHVHKGYVSGVERKYSAEVKALIGK